MPVTTDELLREVILTRELVVSANDSLKAHVEKENPLLAEVQTFIQVHGHSEESRARIAFVHAWMMKEAKRDKLRDAIIEKGVLAALVAIGVFILGVIGTGAETLFKGWLAKGALVSWVSKGKK